MEIIILIISLILIVFFFQGNGYILAIISQGAPYDWTEYGGSTLFAIVADIILLCVIISKILPYSSFKLMRSGLENRKIAKKKFKELIEYLRSEAPDLGRLQELMDKKASHSSTTRTFHFCQLIQMIADEEQLQDCMSELHEKQKILDEINAIEDSILRTAEKCKDAGDIVDCYYYLNILKSTKPTLDVSSLEEECEEVLVWKEKESKAIRLWRNAAIWLLVISILICVGLCIRNLIESYVP